jgi:thiamine biosynthesis lipoprotein
VELPGSADRAAALATSEALVEAVADAERRLSTWRRDSELSRFNAAGDGEPVVFSPATADALRTALDCWRESGGAFDPTVAPLVEAWGLRHGGRTPSASEIERARAAVDAGALLAANGDLLRARPRGGRGVRIEEGGFGKGAALDEALTRARSSAPGAALHLDFGGQLAWSGQVRPVTVRLADPRARARDVLEVEIAAPHGSISTSGNAERGVVVDGVREGHLLDPRTGRPAADFGSATVFDASATRADCRSTALFVLGPERGRSWLTEPGAEREGVLLLVEGEGLRALVTPGLAGRARALVPELEIEVLSSES